MATYTKQELYGSGSLTEALSGQKTFTFTNVSSSNDNPKSSYFTIESILGETGSFNRTFLTDVRSTIAYSSGPISVDTVASGSSKYKWSIVVPVGTSAITVTPLTAIGANKAYLRGTGEYQLVIS